MFKIKEEDLKALVSLPWFAHQSSSLGFVNANQNNQVEEEDLKTRSTKRFKDEFMTIYSMSLFEMMSEDLGQ